MIIKKLLMPMPSARQKEAFNLTLWSIIPAPIGNPLCDFDENLCVISSWPLVDTQRVSWIWNNFWFQIIMGSPLWIFNWNLLMIHWKNPKGGPHENLKLKIVLDPRNSLCINQWLTWYYTQIFIKIAQWVTDRRQDYTS